MTRLSVTSFCLLVSAFWILGSLDCPAQTYTFVSDRKFKDPTDLIGYNFRPGTKESKNGDKQELYAGSYSFGITQNNLYIQGEGIEGMYNINNIQPTEFGFRLLLINARNPAQQGHLKVILNDRKQADALIFKRSTQENEIIFLNEVLSKEQAETEKKFFTDKGELILPVPDSIWRKQIRPFFCIFNADGTQQRQEPKDSVRVEFVKRATILNKTRYIRPKGKDKKPLELPSFASIPEKLSYDNATTELLNSQVKKLEQQYAGILDTFAQRMSEEQSDSVQTMTFTPENFAQVEFQVKEDDYMKLQYRVTYPDGKSEIRKQDFRVKGITEKKDNEAGPNDPKFQWEIKTEKESFFLYLLGDHSVYSFESPERVFYVRGF